MEVTKLSGRFVLENYMRVGLYDGFVPLLPEQAEEVKKHIAELEERLKCPNCDGKGNESCYCDGAGSVDEAYQLVVVLYLKEKKRAEAAEAQVAVLAEACIRPSPGAQGWFWCVICADAGTDGWFDGNKDHPIKDCPLANLPEASKELLEKVKRCAEIEAVNNRLYKYRHEQKQATREAEAERDRLAEEKERLEKLAKSLIDHFEFDLQAFEGVLANQDDPAWALPADSMEYWCKNIRETMLPGYKAALAREGE